MDESTRAAAASFDAIVDEYDARRPGYPERLVDIAVQRAGLSVGDRVLEIGPGTGKLTGPLLDRGLEVTAVEPGPQLATFLGERFGATGALTVQVAGFEHAELPERGFAAAFSATAFHWVDPDLGWARVARRVARGGWFCLLEHISVEDPELGPDDHVVFEAIRRHAPEWADGWPPLRTPDEVLAEADAHRGDVSELWTLLNGRQLARPVAASLFTDVTIDAVPMTFEMTAAEVSALLATMSFHHRLTAGQVTGIDADILAHERRTGRPLRSASLVVMASARVA